MSVSLLRGLGFAVAGIVAAPALADDLNYTYIEGGYVDTELDGGIDVDGDGLLLEASFAITESLFVAGGYTTQDFDLGVDYDRVQVGVGGHVSLAPNFDLVGQLSYVDVTVDTPFGDFDDDGFGAMVGVRSRILEVVELEGGLSYVDLDDGGDDTALNLRGRYYFTPALAAGVGLDIGDDVTTWRATLRYQF